MVLLTPVKLQQTLQVTKPGGGKHNWWCPFCGVVFSSKKEVNSHLLSDHDTKQRLVCKICKKTFQSEAGLKWHMSIHEGTQKHECHICGKKFTVKNHLQGHINRHMGTRPYACRKCGKSYVYQTHLYGHEKKCTVDGCM